MKTRIYAAPAVKGLAYYYVCYCRRISPTPLTFSNTPLKQSIVKTVIWIYESTLIPVFADHEIGGGGHQSNIGAHPNKTIEFCSFSSTYCIKKATYYCISKNLN